MMPRMDHEPIVTKHARHVAVSLQALDHPGDLIGEPPRMTTIDALRDLRPRLRWWLLDRLGCARARSVAPHECYSHEDMHDAECRAAESIRTTFRDALIAEWHEWDDLHARATHAYMRQHHAGGKYAIEAVAHRIGALGPWDPPA